MLPRSVVVLPGAELLKSQMLVEGDRGVVVECHVQDHFAYPELPHYLKTRAYQVGSNPAPAAARVHHQAVQVSQFADRLDRDHAHRVLRAGDQDRPALAEQLAPPAALAPLFGGAKARALQQHDRLEIIPMSGQDADLRVARGVDHRAALW